MQVKFSNIEAASKFYNQAIREGNEITVNDEQYFVQSACITHEQYGGCTVKLELIHIPKITYPKWELGEDYLKEIRQKNTNLKAFTDKVFQVFVGAGHLKEYLKKHNPDGTEK